MFPFFQSFFKNEESFRSAMKFFQERVVTWLFIFGIAIEGGMIDLSQLSESFGQWGYWAGRVALIVAFIGLKKNAEPNLNDEELLTKLHTLIKATPIPAENIVKGTVVIPTTTSLIEEKKEEDNTSRVVINPPSVA